MPMIHEGTGQPMDATPYLMKITIQQDGKPQDPPNATDAEEAASKISPYPEFTEAVDPENGFWNVWLPNYMTDTAWATGIYLDLSVGGYRLQLDLDPA